MERWYEWLKIIAATTLVVFFATYVVMMILWAAFILTSGTCG